MGEGNGEGFLEQLQTVVGEEERRCCCSECNYTERSVDAQKEKWLQRQKHCLAQYGKPVSWFMNMAQEWWEIVSSNKVITTKQRKKLCKPLKPAGNEEEEKN